VFHKHILGKNLTKAQYRKLGIFENEGNALDESQKIKRPTVPLPLKGLWQL